jgi:hypothetical protein
MRRNEGNTMPKALTPFVGAIFMDYIYNDKEKGTIPAPVERWVWGVIYTDGTELKQFDDEGIFHRFAEIDQSKVQMFIMYLHSNPFKRIDMPISPEAPVQLFHFYRNIVKQTLIGEEVKEERVRLYVFGWKEKGKSSSYHFILPDDRLIVCNYDPEDLTKFDI